MHTPYIQPTATDTQATTTATPTNTPNPQEFIHGFSDLEWQMECEPPTLATNPNQLYHLLTITGVLIVAIYPQEHTLGDPNAHYIAWAPLTSTPTNYKH
jgi:hypothetical protein